ncbi:MAG: hypothetical protein AAGF67_00015 [Verrucomicrobiota bacterium]
MNSFPMMRCLSFFAISLALTGCGVAQDESLSEEVGKKVMEAYQGEDFDTVVQLTEGIPDDSSWVRVRAASLQRRGAERFFKADIEGSIEDFDAYLSYFPTQDPHHWQRGLSYYYAEEFEKGKAQFERHQTVNTQDVENAVWHFLCSVRTEGGTVEAAQKELIPIQRDTRVPMKEVHALFAGEGTVEEVLSAAAPNNDNVLSDEERNHLCYAHLYLGLYFEAISDEKQMREHIRLAAFDYRMEHYMGKTAQVHAKLREIGPLKVE